MRYANDHRDAVVKEYLRRRGNKEVPPDLFGAVLDIVRRSRRPPVPGPQSSRPKPEPDNPEA